MSRYDECQRRFDEAYRVLESVICGLSIGDIDGEPREHALRRLSQCRSAVVAGFNERKREELRESAAKKLTEEEREAMRGWCTCIARVDAR
jgi:hypothetical protein